MNMLTQIGKQASELFASMTPSARIMAALMLGTVVVSLGWILTQHQESQQTYILGLLSPEEVRNAEKAFGAALLSDYEVVNGTRIKVPASEKAQYLKALTDGGAIPPQWGDKISQSLDSGIFDPPSLIAKRQSVAREQEFAHNLQRLPQVDFAAVAFDEKRQGFARETEKVCSIQVQQFGSRPIDTSVLRHIAESATTYFAGLKKENVSVFDLGSSNIYRASSNGNSADENLVLAAQVEWEEKYYQQVSERLSQYGAIKLAVSVELDNTVLQESEKLEYDPTGVSLETSSTRKDTETAKAPRGGRPGYASNAANTPATVSNNTPEQTSKIKETGESIRSEFGKHATRTRVAGLVPKEVKISVGIPESYFRKVFAHRWQLENPDLDPAEATPPTQQQLTDVKDEVIAEVESAITVIPIGFRQGEDRKPYINVSSYTDLPLPEMPEPTLADNSLAWLAESWSTVAMIVLVLVSLAMMFSWVKGQQNDPETERRFSEGFGLQVPDQVVDELDLSIAGAGGEGGDGDRDKPQFEVTGEEMKEDLSTLIKENPDAAVNLLKTWIGDAA